MPSGLFLALALAQQSVDTSAQVYFISPGMEKAIVYCLSGIGSLFAAWGTYWLTRAWKLRNVQGDQRRGNDPRLVKLEDDARSLGTKLQGVKLEMEARMATLEGAIKADAAKTEMLRSDMHSKFEHLQEDITSLVGQVGEIKGTLGGLETSVRQAMNWCMEFVRNPRRIT